MTSAMSEGLVTFAINYENTSGNPGSQVTSTTNTSSVTFDKTPPSITILSPSSGDKVNNRQITFNISETNLGTTTASADGTTFVNFTSGMLANQLGGFSSLPEGSFTATIRHIDAAGNIGEGTINLIKDVTPPDISSISLNCSNSVVTITFTEPVYGNTNASGTLSDSKFSVSRTGSGANVSGFYLNPVPPAGSSIATMTLIWNGSFTGNEILNVDAVNNTSIYDEAGNAMLSGTPATYHSNIPITINQHPQNTTVCVGLPANISVNANAGYSVAYQWQVNTGSGWSNISNNSTYSGATTNTLSISSTSITMNGWQYRVIISNDCYNGVNATISNVATLTVNPNTEITQDPQDNVICEGSVANLSVSATGTLPITYTWQYHNGSNWVNAINGTPANAVYSGLGTDNISVAGLPPGNHQYRVIVDGGCGLAQTSSTATITVNPVPDASISASGQTSFCFGGDVTLTAAEPTATNITYQWFKDGSPIANANDRELTVNETGSYSVTVTNTTTNCSASTTSPTVVTVYPLPVPTISGTNITTTGVDITLETEQGMSNYTWDVDGGTISANNGYQITVSWSTTGVKNVTVTYTDTNGCQPAQPTVYQVGVGVSCINVAITQQPTASQTVCEGTNVTLSVTATGTNPEYAWYKDGSSTVLGTNSSLVLNNIQVSDAGQYYVVVSNNCSSVQSNNAVVNVITNATPSVSIAISSGTNPTCSGNAITFVATPTNGGSTPSYQWKVNGNNVGTNQPTYTYTPQNNDVVTVEMTSSLTCVSTQTVTSNSITMTVNPVPSAPTVTPVVHTYSGAYAPALTASGEVGATIKWYSDAGLSNLVYTGNTFNHTHKDAGTYTYYVTQTVSNCESPASIATVTINKAQLTVSADDKSKSYGQSDPELTYVITGFVGGENVITANVTGSPILNRQSGEDVGAYTIFVNLNNLSAPNYSFAAQNGTLTINKATLTFTADNKSKCQGSPNPTLTYSISGFVFGENQSVIDQLPNISTTADNNSSAGIYPITLSGGSDNNYDYAFVNGTLTVYPLPVPTISGPTNGQAGSAITLNTETGKTNYAWTAQGNPTITNGSTSSPSFVWNNPGNYIVTVTYTDDNGCSGTSNDYTINISDICNNVAITTQPQNQTACVGASATFSVVASGTNPQYAWYKQGNPTPLSTTSSLTINPVQLSDAGDYYVVVSNSCPSTDTSNTVTLTVNQAPDQPSAITGNTTVCAGTNGVTYSVTNVSGVTYTWSYSGSNVTIASGQGTNEVTLNFASNATSGTLTVTPSNATCGNGTPQTLAITVNALPSISAHPQNTSVAEGANASFSVTATGGTLSYQWQENTGSGWNDITGATSATLTLNSVTASMEGNKYRVVVSNGCGSVNSNAATLTIIAATPSQQPTFLLSSTKNDITVYNITPPTTPDSTGMFRLFLAIKGPSAPSQNPENGTSYSANSDWAFAPALDNGRVVRVVYDGNVTSFAITGLNSNTTYRIIAYGYNQIGTNVATRIYNTTVTLGYNSKTVKTKLKESFEDEIITGTTFEVSRVAPNPVSNEMYLDVIGGNASTYVFELYNSVGERVFTRTMELPAGRNEVVLSVQNAAGILPAGVYNLRVRSGAEYIDQRIVIMP
ncbi:MAG TPA: MBG domain-containing protein [Candidatus Kapabacteria bacterium]|nr:MBG domain-containing protein [Candidatus Kapabacteria bacterium]